MHFVSGGGFESGLESLCPGFGEAAPHLVRVDAGGDVVDAEILAGRPVASTHQMTTISWSATTMIAFFLAAGLRNPTTRH